MTDEKLSGRDRGPTDDTGDGSAIPGPVPAGEKDGSDGATRNRRSVSFASVGVPCHPFPITQ